MFDREGFRTLRPVEVPWLVELRDGRGLESFWLVPSATFTAGEVNPFW